MTLVSAAMTPRVLICGTIVWAHGELHELLGSIADIVYLDSSDRETFLAEFNPGRKYENTIGIYRTNDSSEKIGIFDQKLIDGLPSSVEWIAQNGAGYDSIDVYACKARGIYVSNTPVVVNDATATAALYLMIAVFRQFTLAEHSLRGLKWKPPGISSNACDPTGKTLAILGLGGIGMRLAQFAHTFPMRIIYHSRHKNALAPEYCEYFKDIDEMLKQADVLSIHVPLTPDTVNLVDANRIQKLRRGAIIINTARGRVVDEEAMIQALVDGHLGAVGLDVFPNEPGINPYLLKSLNVALLPHMGTETKDTQKAMEVRAFTNLRDFFISGKGKDLVVEFNAAQTPKSKL